MSMSSPVPSGMPSSTPVRKRRPGRWLAVVGLALWVIAGTMIGFGIARFDAGEFTDLVEDPASALNERIPSPGKQTVNLDSGKYWVFAMGDRLRPAGSDVASDTAARNFTPPQLTVRGPDGPVAVNDPNANVSIGGTNSDMVLLYEFRAERDGRYALTSDGGSARVTELGVGDTDELWDSAKQILGPVALIVVGGLIGVLGGILLLVAAILWITSRSGKDTGPSQAVDGTSPFG